ncbi:histidine-type phosphatase [archaeon]|nr:MAG: histidine-type phosphatase [archaeon]
MTDMACYCVILCLLMVWSCAGAEEGVKSIPYIPLAADHILEQLILLHRHGDRSQINPGFEPHIPPSNVTTQLWNSLMPRDITKRRMSLHANPSQDKLDSLLYTGHDQTHIPYGQLTEIGAEQLFNLGTKLKTRYQGHLDLTMQSMHLRSTNYCRTLQSLRSLLAGFLVEPVNPVDLVNSAEAVPIIHTIHDRHQEVMIPQDTHCPHVLLTRRMHIHDTLRHTHTQYGALEQKLSYLVNMHGFLPWIDLHEVLVCLHTHSEVFGGYRDVYERDQATLLSDILSMDDFEVIEDVLVRVWMMMYQVRCSHMYIAPTHSTHTHTHIHIYTHTRTQNTHTQSYTSVFIHVCTHTYTLYPYTNTYSYTGQSH